MCENDEEPVENNEFTLTACASFEGWDLYLEETIAPEEEREMVLEIKSPSGESGRYNLGRRDDVKPHLERLRQALQWLQADMEQG